MTEYQIGTYIINISTEEENYRYYYKTMKVYLNNTESQFDNWYKSQYDCISVYKNAEDIINKVSIPIINECVDILNNQGIYSIDQNTLIQSCLVENFESFFNILEDMLNKLQEIEQTQNEEEEYRRYRKASRSRVIGGGFGLGGAIKGMAKAGAINATTGMAHSMVNTIGNIGSAIAASASKSSLYSKCREPLKEALYNSVSQLSDQLMLVIENNTNLRFKYVTVSEADKARAILSNYKANRISEDKKLEQIVEALRNNPYKIDIYKTIWEDFGDFNRELRRMANDFDIPLEIYIQNLAEEHCEKIYVNYCNEYINAKNPILVAVKIEDKIKSAINEIKEYCEKQNIDLDSIKSMKKCNSLLDDIENELRNFNGILYPNREIALKHRMDRNKLYDYLKGKNINTCGLCEEVKNIQFLSDEYKNDIEKIFQKEIILRNPIKIFDNLKQEVIKYFSDSKTNLGNIEVSTIDNSIIPKVQIIKKLIEMPENEIPMMLVNYASNGKSGILITNLAFRVYSKGIFSSSSRFIDLQDIQNIECNGDDEYTIQTLDEPFNFKIKSGLNIIDQNNLSKLLEEVIMRIKNLYISDRINLKDICLESIQCECGAYLPVSSKICPNCFKMYTKEGSFVETVICEHCGNRVKVGKRFCNKCGEKLVEEVDEKIVEDINTVSEIVEDINTASGIVEDTNTVSEIVEDINAASEIVEDTNTVSEIVEDINTASEIAEDTNKVIETDDKISEIVIDKKNITSVKPEKLMINCVFCGNKIKLGKKFCDKCGKEVQLSENMNEGNDLDISNNEIRICPKCGNKVKIGKKFCSQCGTKF